MAAEKLNLDPKLVEDFLDFYWQKIKKGIVNCEGLHINVENLGTFSIKPWKLKELIERYEYIVNKYQKRMDNDEHIGFQGYAILKDCVERLETLRDLQLKIDEENEKKKEIRKKRDEYIKNIQEPGSDT